MTQSTGPSDSLRGKTVVVTGATNGIGLAAAEAFARAGASLVVTGRDPGRLRAAIDRLDPLARMPVRGLLADFSSFGEVRRLAAELLDACPRIDVLLLNAGLISTRPQNGVEGYELTFTVNHLAPYLLTRLLTDRLIASAPARVILTASRAHEYAERLDLDDTIRPRRYRWMRIYGRSKLANILFTRECARRLAGTGVVINCFHPGVVATGLFDKPGVFGFIWRLIGRRLKTPEQGAATAIMLATTADRTITGQYWSDGRVATPSAAARDPALAEALWRRSAELCGLDSA